MVADPPPASRILKSLFEDILDERCVLLLGPELGERSYPSHLSLIYERIVEDYSQDDLEYLEDIGLILFRNSTAKLDAQRAVKRHYGEMEFSEAFHKKILEIPFSLIISLTPDIFLSDLGRRYGIPHQKKYFQHKGQAQEPVQAPTRKVPLFYNLLGSIEQEESLVIDYEDLFNFLSRILGAPGIPEKIRTTLDKAWTFFFIGFDFEKWYTHLLLQLLLKKSRDGARRIALNARLNDTRAKTFLIHQFSLQFFGSEQHFFEQLYDRFRVTQKLRKLKQPLPGDTVDYLRQLVANDEIAGAIADAMHYACGTSCQDKAFALSGRYKSLRDKEKKGVLFASEQSRELNIIREDLLKLIDDLK